MPSLNPPLQLKNPESDEHARYVMDVASQTDFEYPPVSEMKLFRLPQHKIN